MAGWNNSSLTRRLGSLHPAEENVTAPLLYFSLLSFLCCSFHSSSFSSDFRNNHLSCHVFNFLSFRNGVNLNAVPISGSWIL